MIDRVAIDLNMSSNSSSTNSGLRTTGGFTTGSYASAFVSIAQLNDHLYLCGARAVNATALHELGVTCVVNATVELPNLTCVPDVEFVKVSVDDTPYADLGSHFDGIADKIDEVHRGGGRTLVHCVAGVSRSASLCIAYLMKHVGMTLRDAYDHVKERRPIVRPNNGFFRQLVEYERRLAIADGRSELSTVRLIASHVGLIPDVYEQEYRNLLMLTTPPGPPCRSALSEKVN